MSAEEVGKILFHPSLCSMSRNLFNDFCLLIFLYLVLPHGVFALEPHRDVTQYTHRVWLKNNGLPTNSLRGLTQDEQGYIWIPAGDNVIRFDGQRFVTFTPEQIPQIKSSIYSINSTSDGSVWFGTIRTGVVRYKNGAAEEFNFAKGSDADTVLGVYEARDGSIWFGTRYNGVVRLKDGQLTTFTENLSDKIVWAITETNDGALWIGAGSELARFENENFIFYGASSGLNLAQIGDLCVDKQNRLWIGARDGVGYWENNSFTNLTNVIQPNGVVFDILADKDSNIWIASYGGGVIRYREGQRSVFGMAQGLKSNKITKLLEDREGSIWFTADDGGLNQLYDAAVTSLTTRDGLITDDNIWTILESRNGDIWIGSEGGLSRFQNGKITNFTNKEGLSDNLIWAITEISDGSLLLSTNADKVDRYHNGKFQTLDGISNLKIGIISTILEDKTGNLWFGAERGLFKLKDGQITIYNRENGLADIAVRVLLQSRDSSIWVGTQNGLQRVDGNQNFETFTTQNGLPSNLIRALHEDSEGILWIATDQGLTRMEQNGRFATVNKQTGLPDNTLNSVLSDDFGNLWMSCKLGIFKIQKAETESFFRGEKHKIEHTSFGESEGMKSSETSGGIQPSAWRAADGKFWFPTAAGVVSIDPQNLRENKIAPNVIIEEVLFNEKPQQFSEKLNVPAGINRVDFRFTAPTFRAPEKIKLQYQLVGYDREWQNADNSKRQISYTNLSPGNYTFRVKAANENGVWNEAGASLSLYITPRFYQTWWFYLLCLLSFSGLGFLLYRLRLGQINHRFGLVLAERTRIAREIHDTLAQNLLATTLQLEAAEEKLDENAQPIVKKHLVQARALALEGLNEARNSISSLREQPSVKDKSLEEELERFARQVTGGTNLNLQFKVVGKPNKLPELIEHNFFRIGQEALNNAVKHSAAKNIAVELAFDSKNVRLQVADDGCGFDAQQNASKPSNGQNGSYGLLGLKERAKIIGASFTVESELNKGTKIIAVVRNNAVKE